LLECLDTPIVSAIATVSTCSGTDAAATEIAHRTGAAAEAMEGAAVGLVAFRHKVAFAEVRVISNTTGDRSRQVWALEESLAELGKFVREHHDRAT
jgi:futalosine hydrolase